MFWLPLERRRTPPMLNPHDASKQVWALVTGGSHGIGKALAFECIQRGIGVAIVALPDDNLRVMESELRTMSSAKFHTLGLNLVQPGAVEEVCAWLQSQNIHLSYLINNAGFGRGGLIEHTSWSEYLTMMQLNNQLMVELTLAVLPQLKANRGGILNMSSMEATLPLPYKTVYTGTKGFVYNYSLALRQELRHYGVGVTVLCPGPVITNEDGLRRVKAMGALAQVLVTVPKDIAPEAITGFLQNKDVVRPGKLVAFLLILAQGIPRGLKMRLFEKLFSKYRESSADSAGPHKSSKVHLKRSANFKSGSV